MQTQISNIDVQAAALAQLSAKYANTLAHDVAEALSNGGRSQIEALALKLQSQVSELRPHLDVTILRELREAGQTIGPIAQAYGLGQLVFAQLLTAKVADASADDNFEELLKGSKYVAYVKALLGSERTSAELKNIVTEREETVSRKLRELRELGAADFRRDGREVVNFLTPLAQEVAKQIYGDENQMSVVTTERYDLCKRNSQEAKLQRVFGDSPLPPYMQALPNMGKQEEHGQAHA
jgi:DNA-binding transcriptional ArsR family regulator